MVQYYNTGGKEQSHFVSYAHELTLFASLFSDMLSETRDYGNNRPIKAVDVSTLSLIEKNPGVTVSELAEKQNRTKGTVSSIVSNLEKEGYIYREKRSGTAKVVHLYATTEGERLNTLYIAFITKKMTSIQNELLKTCSISDINSFCKVLHEYVKFLSKEASITI